MTPLQVFCRQVRVRSLEHRRAVRLLQVEGLSAQIMAILRQELDSMVRVIYLLSITDLNYRNELIKASVDGKQWTVRGSKQRVTDREMVDLADRLHGWTASVYRFGCAFIHLSSFHDYHERDPLNAISDDEKTAILSHLRHYHGGPTQTTPTVNDIVPYLPRVFDKIAANLECYIEELETQAVIQTDDL